MAEVGMPNLHSTKKTEKTKNKKQKRLISAFQRKKKIHQHV
jgi:hypothetical protein